LIHILKVERSFPFNLAPQMGLLLSGYDYTINTAKHSTIFIILKEFVYQAKNLKFLQDLAERKKNLVRLEYPESPLSLFQ
jgi:hypothetical protein